MQQIQPTEEVQLLKRKNLFVQRLLEQTQRKLRRSRIMMNPNHRQKQHRQTVAKAQRWRKLEMMQEQNRWQIEEKRC